jgi:hypothetical protein
MVTEANGGEITNCSISRFLEERQRIFSQGHREHREEKYEEFILHRFRPMHTDEMLIQITFEIE